MDDDAGTCYRHPDQATRIGCQRCERPICPDCMIPGPVGFQCPECVEQARLPSGVDPRITSGVLIAINVLVWGAVLVTGQARSTLLELFALLPAGLCRGSDPSYYYPGVTDAATCAAHGLTWVPGVTTGAPWQLLTSGFTHESLMHLGFNMLVLWLLGPQLERVIGRARFLGVYFASLLGGSTAVLLLAEPTSQTVGASGAIYGLLAAVLLLTLKHRGNWRQVVIWLAINTVFTVVYPGISWQGHLGGFVAGLATTAAVLLVARARRPRLPRGESSTHGPGASR